MSIFPVQGAVAVSLERTSWSTFFQYFQRSPTPVCLTVFTVHPAVVRRATSTTTSLMNGLCLEALNSSSTFSLCVNGMNWTVAYLRKSEFSIILQLYMNIFVN